MSSKPENCPHCGALITSHDDEEAAFQTCAVCDAELYPIPPILIACILINERREFLFTKRAEPESPKWSLPMGFAATGETVTQAAVRVLKSAAGLEGEILRLIDASPAALGPREDLTVLTFEMIRTGGQEQAGVNIDKLAYFPHSRHPDLICAANEKAVKLCAENHLEEWMINDSFERLQNDADRAMLSDELVQLIRDGADDILLSWLEDVRENQTTKAYARLDENAFNEYGGGMLSQFGCWLSDGAADRDVTEFYFQIGKELRKQGLPAHEVLSALMLLKKHVWQFARNRGVWKRPIDAYRVLELNRRIVVFFDKAMYHAARGLELME